jgi:FMN phosphatase YigB (HAD superfamily)
MIGDNLTADIEGAMAANLKAMYFNPSRMPHTSSPDFEISHLKQVTELL